MDVMQYIDKGGMIMYILLGLNILGWSVMLLKFMQYWVLFLKKDKTVREIYYRIDSYRTEKKYVLGEDILRETMLGYESGLSTVKIIASIAPLLGLLGTVVGVMFAFDTIAKQGLGDPSVFSSGISLALVTTVGGLIVAIPHYVGYNYLIGMLDRLEAQLTKELNQKIYGEHS